MGKKERKLTPKEQKRKEKFEDLSSEMIKMGYKKTDLTLGTLTANLLAIPIMLPFMALGLLIFKLTQANVKIIIMIEIFDLIILFGILLVLIVIHELIHGLTWGHLQKIILSPLILALFGQHLHHIVHVMKLWKNGSIY